MNALYRRRSNLTRAQVAAVVVDVFDIISGDATVVRRLLNDVQFVDYLRDTQEVIDAAFEETTNVET